MKLDLHTHLYEATGFRQVTRDIVARIIAQIKARGLDGIAVTEHNDKVYGYRVKELAQELAPEVVIIPGQEINAWPVQIVELFLPGEVTFRFLAHPGYPGELEVVNSALHGIEIDNPLHSWHINRERVKAIAQKYNLLLLSNSDAHSLEDMGQFYNEVSLEELIARAQRDGSQA